MLDFSLIQNYHDSRLAQAAGLRIFDILLLFAYLNIDWEREGKERASGRWMWWRGGVESSLMIIIFFIIIGKGKVGHYRQITI